MEQSAACRYVRSLYSNNLTFTFIYVRMLSIMLLNDEAPDEYVCCSNKGLVTILASKAVDTRQMCAFLEHFLTGTQTNPESRTHYRVCYNQKASHKPSFCTTQSKAIRYRHR